jgi:hypothetical protein
MHYLSTHNRELTMYVYDNWYVLDVLAVGGPTSVFVHQWCCRSQDTFYDESPYKQSGCASSQMQHIVNAGRQGQDLRDFRHLPQIR